MYASGAAKEKKKNPKPNQTKTMKVLEKKIWLYFESILGVGESFPNKMQNLKAIKENGWYIWLNKNFSAEELP